jgi:hypothetical protein
MNTVFSPVSVTSARVHRPLVPCPCLGSQFCAATERRQYRRFQSGYTTYIKLCILGFELLHPRFTLPSPSSGEFNVDLPTVQLTVMKPQSTLQSRSLGEFKERASFRSFRLHRRRI